jgi:hypothetical protein
LRTVSDAPTPYNSLTEEEDGYSADYALTEPSESYDEASFSIAELSDDALPLLFDRDDGMNADYASEMNGSREERCGSDRDSLEYEDEERFWSGEDVTPAVVAGINFKDSVPDEAGHDSDDDAVSLGSEGGPITGDESLDNSQASSDDMGPPAERTSDMERWPSIYDEMGDAISRINGPHP